MYFFSNLSLSLTQTIHNQFVPRLRRLYLPTVAMVIVADAMESQSYTFLFARLLMLEACLAFSLKQVATIMDVGHDYFFSKPTQNHGIELDYDPEDNYLSKN